MLIQESRGSRAGGNAPRRAVAGRRTVPALALLLAVSLMLSGCGLVALPFRAAGDVVEVVPVVGKPVGAPVHAVGDAID